MNSVADEVRASTARAVHWLYNLPPLVAGLIGLTLLVLTLWAHWRIVKRAGYPGCWSLMLLVPILNLLFLAGFAFSKWPIEKRGR